MNGKTGDRSGTGRTISQTASRPRARKYRSNTCSQPASRRKIGALFSLCATLLAVSACQSGPETCEIGRIGPLPILNDTRSPIVKITLNGKPAAIIVDTGASFSLVTADATREFDLAYTGQYGTIRGIAGFTSASVVRADKMGLGDATASDTLFTETSVHMGRIAGLPVVGLFGADFLVNYDVKFDLPHRKITLYRMQGCSSKDIVWPHPVDAVPLEPEDGNKFLVPFRINGQPIDAILDSGASRTVIKPSQARKAGVTRDMLAGDREGVARGISDDKLVSHLHRFDTLEVGPKKYRNPWLVVAPLETDTALLGADFLRHVVAWLSWYNRTLYIEKPHPDGSPDPAGTTTPNPAGEPAGQGTQQTSP